VRWDEIPEIDPREFTMKTMPDRYAQLGDLHAGIDDAVFALDPLLEWAERDRIVDLDEESDEPVRDHLEEEL
jgi:DNA primase